MALSAEHQGQGQGQGQPLPPGQAQEHGQHQPHQPHQPRQITDTDSGTETPDDPDRDPDTDEGRDTDTDTDADVDDDQLPLSFVHERHRTQPLVAKNKDTAHPQLPWRMKDKVNHNIHSYCTCFIYFVCLLINTTDVLLLLLHVFDCTIRKFLTI